MIFIEANTLGSSGISMGKPVFGSLSVVIITMGKLLSVKVWPIAANDSKNEIMKNIFILMRLK
jgi:hypothetical protein